MRASVFLPFAISGLLLSSAAVRADSPAPPSAASSTAAAAPSAGDKIVCRMMAAKTGSRLGARRECRSEKEWDDIQHQNQDETSKMQARGLTSGVKGQ